MRHLDEPVSLDVRTERGRDGAEAPQRDVVEALADRIAWRLNPSVQVDVSEAARRARVAGELVRGECELRIDGVAERFAVASAGDEWVAARHRGNVVVTVAAVGIAPADVHLRALADPTLLAGAEPVAGPFRPLRVSADQRDVRLIAYLAGRGPLADIADDLAQLVRPALRLVALDAAATRGASKLGGLPDLPAGWDWPVRRSARGAVVALRFIAQIALSDLDLAVWPGPRTGLLSIFHDFAEGEGDEPVTVLHLPAGGDLQPARLPSSGWSPDLLDELAVSFVSELALPDVGAVPARALDALGIDSDEPGDDLIDDYLGLLDALADAHDLQGAPARMLGWPWFVHDDVLDEQAEPADDPQSWTDYSALLSIWTTEDAVTTFVLPTSDLMAGRFDRVRAGSQF